MDKYADDKKTADIVAAEFERYWLANKNLLLAKDDEYTKATGKYKITSGADWLLWALPFAVAFSLDNLLPIENEMINLLVCIIAAFLCFVLCVWVKTLITGVPNLTLLENKVKEKSKLRWMHEHYSLKNK